jgi:Mo-co oxidoreductase dimerisation domain
MQDVRIEIRKTRHDHVRRIVFENTSPELGTLVLKGMKAFKELVQHRYIIPGKNSKGVRRHTRGNVHVAEQTATTAKVRVTSSTRLPGAKLKAGAVTVSGVAYNDGSARLESVLVSFDRGHSWQPAEFRAPDSPYAWYQWTARANLKPGVYEIWSRAIDALGRTQPLDGSIFWSQRIGSVEQRPGNAEQGDCLAHH